MLKRILAVALAAAMILGLAGVTFAASPFPDTAGIDEEGVIAQLKALGLVKGDDLGYFNPNDTITRAEFCAMIVRALGLEAAAGYLATPTVFPDVTPAQAWAYGYINVAVTRGIIKGYPDGTFRPQGPVTQAEALTMIMRALGYKDSLPGDWPLDYIMAGASDTVGLVEAGFVPNASATRAFVAKMIGTMLGCKLVSEDKDNPGEFTVTDRVFGKEKLGVEDGPEGMVSAVNTTDKTLTIGGTAYGYDAAVVVYGVDSVSALKGYQVTTVKNSKGNKIIFVSTSVEYITGKVAAVDVANETITIGETKYDVASGLVATKNGVQLTGSVANMLVALAGTTANAWVNDDGEVYKIEARYLDVTNKVIEKKTVAVDMSGTVYKLKFQSDTNEYQLAKEVVISRNGLAAGWANLEKGDSCDFALEDGKIVWLDAWNQVVEDAQVTASYEGSNNKQIVVLVNGVSQTYQVAKDSKFWEDEDSTTYTALPKVGAYYDLYIGRDGKVYGGTETTDEVLAVSGTIAGISIETTVVNGSAKPAYKVVLSDGSSIVVPLAKGWTGVKKDNADLTVGENVATFFTDYFEVGDGISADRKADGSVTTVRLYSANLSGTVSVNTTDGTFKITDSSGNIKSGDIKLASGAEVTFNGTRADLSKLAGKKARVTWDIAKGVATKVQGYQFADETPTAVIGISESEGAYQFTVRNRLLTLDESSKDAVVIKDGAAAKLSDIALGDKICFSTDGEFIEAFSDTEAPKLDGAVTAKFATDKVTVTIKFNEEVQPPTVWIDGVKYVLTDDNATDYITWEVDVSATPIGATVSVALTAKDYAGNVLNATPGLISVTGN